MIRLKTNIIHPHITRRNFILGTAAAAALAALPAPALATPKSSVREIYKGKRGVTLYLDLAHGPFPSPGSRHKDSTTIVFVPHHFRTMGNKVDTVLHFHGHNSTAEGVMKKHQLREQLYESKQNAILVMPQGPVRASSSDGGKLDQDKGLLRFLTDLRKTLTLREARKAMGRARIGKRDRIGMLIISAHSGAYRVAARCITNGGFNVNEVYLFDSLYGDVRFFNEWLVERKKRKGRDRHKLISYYAFGKVAEHNRRLMAALDKAKIPYLHEKKEGTLSRADITTARAVFIRTRQSHDGVTHGLNAMRDCLYASCLKRRLRSDWFDDKDGKRSLDRRDAE